MSHLEDLAPELFEAVAECLENSDLPALRLTSKTCDAKVFRHYATTLFAHRTIRLGDESSVQKITAVMQTTAFKSAVRSVTLEIPKDGISRTRCFHYLSSLTKVFKRLRKSKKMCTLQIIRVGSGVGRIEDSLRFTLPLAALRLSGLALSSLTIGMNDFLDDTKDVDVWPAPINKIIKNPYRKALFTDTVRNLSSLRLTAWIDEFGSADVHDFMQIIASAPRLRHFAFYGAGSQQTLWSQTFPVLESLEVFDLCINLGSAINFCHRHGQLRLLSLLNVFIYGHEGYAGPDEDELQESLDSHMKRRTGVKDVVTDVMSEIYWTEYLNGEEDMY